MYVESCFVCSVIIVIGIVIIFYKRKKYLSINNVSQHCTKEDPSVHGRVHYVYRWFSSILHSLFRGWENPASTYCTVGASIRSHVGDSGCMVAHKTRSKKCHTATTAFVVVVFFFFYRCWSIRNASLTSSCPAFRAISWTFPSPPRETVLLRRPRSSPFRSSPPWKMEIKKEKNYFKMNIIY